MQDSTVKRLVALNRAFYDGFAADFAESRTKLHDGIVRSLDSLVREEGVSHILDVGCGSARVGKAIKEAPYAGFDVQYTGLDFSEDLASSIERPAHFVAADVTQKGWSNAVDTPGDGFGALVSFSVLHHVPGREQQKAFFRECASLLAPGGKLIISVWQLLHVPRLAKKVRPWSELGLRKGDLESGDLLVDWKRGGSGLRYVHHFDEAELRAIAASADLTPTQSWRSDGATGDMGLYMVFSLTK
jgi:SAM-dependent methyltransferase